jgi:hypothetical protein
MQLPPTEQSTDVAMVDRVVDVTSGTFGVRPEVPNADYAGPHVLRRQVHFLQAE